MPDITIYRSDVEWKDSFQTLLGEWKKRNYVDVVPCSSKCCWVNEIGSTLLYEHDQLNYIPDDFDFGFFANSIPSRSSNISAKCVPWIYWGRYPELIEKEKENIVDKKINSIFIGRVENYVQAKYRNIETWESVVDVFILRNTAPNEYILPPLDYLRALNQSKFGLCLRGFGPKCQREIELMALGTIPLVTPLTDINNYYDPPRQGKHFFYINGPEDMVNVIKNCSEWQRQEMSKNCRDWYNKNCSIEGSFNTTLETLNKYGRI